MQSKTIPTVVLGGSGYVSAELVRLLLGHPAFRLEHVVSASHVGQRLDEVFPHLAGACGDLKFTAMEEAQTQLATKKQAAVFSAMQHGASAAALQELLCAASPSVKAVDVSADFRLKDPAEFKSVYGADHGAPALFDQFTCALPDLEHGVPEGHVSHPGCFTTCVSLGSAPLTKLGLLESPTLIVSAVTGSSGAGRQPKSGTHHPERQSALWAYEPLKHRHVREMEQLLEADGQKPQVHFVPHSGPFSRGIHATIFANAKKAQKASDLVETYADFYASSPFVSVGTRMPSVKEVVGSNRCHIGVAVQGRQIVVTSVIDNLVKGAAGGAVQWMNRLLSLEEGTGLTTPVPGWV
ncbi:MAG: N-acetyl-gamma-glutamyl-phosphate reductase [Armatimonadetes bacterium]|nr:N-acetyl-gamma-glutamyl-phosphate reductase [Armatimonadota bacterium]